MTNQPSFTEHRVPRDQGSLYARDYAGAGPAFVLMHGFPDNLHIYDYLIPHLVARGPARRRVRLPGLRRVRQARRRNLQLRPAAR